LVFGLNELLGRNTPRWILAVVAGPEETDYIAGRINETSLPPEPTLIGGKLDELKAGGKQMRNPRIEVGTLKVHNYARVTQGMLYRMKRKGGITLGALKACVARWGVDDKRKAHVTVERDRAIEVNGGKCYLV